MAAVGTDVLVDWLSRYRETVTAQRDWLTELDSAIGDADHGANMARGFTAVGEKLAATTPSPSA